ncbi:hypothetical protein EDD18DRAFT_1356141 [Armillaria luteobubalina]|uniref:Uncharacterized protein n=1 Tax=Armillaria luteobubalina TaxID=153913 RepID=A0AA39Q1K7_9AGAR|nr:hypothetical protein EDD18DRAFT_1356141 [Armillaria luteobubalina]
MALRIDPQVYLNSLDNIQLAQLVLALEQHGLVSGIFHVSLGINVYHRLIYQAILAPAALPTVPGPPAAQRTEPDHTHASSSLGGSEATLSQADVAVTAVPESNNDAPSLPSKLTHARPNQQSTWYTVTVSYRVGIFQGWDIVAPLVPEVNSAVYLPHPSHAAASTHYANAIANDEVKIILTDSEGDA